MNIIRTVALLVLVAVSGMTGTLRADTIVKRDFLSDLKASRTAAVYKVKSSTCVVFAKGPGCHSVRYSLVLVTKLRGQPTKNFDITYRPAIAETIPVGTDALFYEVVGDGERNQAGVFRSLLPIANLSFGESRQEVVLLDSLTAAKAQLKIRMTAEADGQPEAKLAFLSEDTGRNYRAYVPLSVAQQTITK